VVTLRVKVVVRVLPAEQLSFIELIHEEAILEGGLKFYVLAKTL